jgi:hypothetical protein
MYERNVKEYTILDAVTPVAITSSTDATPIVMTVASHGLITGDLVLIQGHATNIAANGIFEVLKLTANTFSLKDRYTHADVAGSGAGDGTNTGFIMKAPRVILVEDFRNAIISIFTSGTSTMTIKCEGSIGKINNSSINMTENEPNFGATVSASNPYAAIQIINLDTSAAVNGATGVVLSGADTQSQYEVNVNLLKYFTVYPSSWTQGTITVKAVLSGNI